jgi:hypothetical protein
VEWTFFNGCNGLVPAVQRGLTAARRDAAVHEAGNGQMQTFG